ncbi:DedA family protein [Clostridium tarantellae]|uniref:DedA family protein n=1 Tax=Clostridium tarantellae TaxID=39493 RepID=A0A6I1MMA0_9CLOT|nr:DedA family protein [Clostridium tarantellae]MPQ43578.1 DedA family protein [Clostridium tarantellae]
MEHINEIVNIIIAFIGQLGYIGIYIIVTLEYSIIPIPSEIVLPLLGFSAFHGEFSLLGVLICSTLGALTGSILCYSVGYFGGNCLINSIERRRPKSTKIFKDLKFWFSKHAKITVLLARIIPMTRTAVSILAGVERLSLIVYITYTSLGILLWNGTLILAGYFIGDNLTVISSLVKKYNILCILILSIILIIFLYLKFKKKKNNN